MTLAIRPNSVDLAFKSLQLHAEVAELMWHAVDKSSYHPRSTKG